VKQSESENNEKYSNPAKIAILGLGGAGVKICAELVKTALKFDIAVLDFDEKSLMSFSGGKIITPKNSFHGYSSGTGGDIIVGERLSSLCRQKISEFLNGHEILIAIAGMGGGSGSAAAPIVAREAKKCGIQTIFLVTLPFSFEGHKRRILAEKSIENLIIDADIVIPIANDILFSSMPADSPFAEAFLKADIEITKATEELSKIFTSENYISSTLPNLKNIVNRKKTTCIIGYGESKVESSDFSVRAVEQLFDSPLLGGLSEVRKSDAALIVISAGEKIGIGPIKRTFERVKIQLKDDAEIVCVLSKSPDEKSFKVTLIGIKYDETNLFQKTSQKKHLLETKKTTYTQDELPLFTPKKGIFTNSSDNFYKNQDLDIPVFQRKGINIDPGQ